MHATQSDTRSWRSRQEHYIGPSLFRFYSSLSRTPRIIFSLPPALATMRPYRPQHPASGQSRGARSANPTARGQPIYYAGGGLPVAPPPGRHGNVTPASGLSFEALHIPIPGGCPSDGRRRMTGWAIRVTQELRQRGLSRRTHSTDHGLRTAATEPHCGTFVN